MIVIHGGFWQSAYTLSHAGHLCAALTSLGIVTCNIEYRRLGDPGGGWPGTFRDVSQAADRILETVGLDPTIDSNRVAVLGHSAGGHLALWLASRHRIPKNSPLHCGHAHRVAIGISLAGVSDLRTAWSQKVGHGIVSKLMGGTPDEYPDRYDSASPIELLPSGTRQMLIHGTADSIVPVSQSERFVEKAERLGEAPTLLRLEGVGHFELIDPESGAWTTVSQNVLSLLNAKTLA